MIGSQPGSYALIFSLTIPVQVTVGRLGLLNFEPGQYIYCGSALGPGGMRARISHHVYAASKPHWHIDWLRPYATFEGVCCRAGREKIECCWQQAFLLLKGVAIAAVGFGASDCRSGCRAHLLVCRQHYSIEALAVYLETSWPGVQAISL